MHVKRGSSQVDWAISLGIFVIYIAWFFIMIKPAFVQDQEISPLLEVVEESFLSNVTWQVDKIPVFYNSSINSDDEPVIIWLGLENSSELSFPDNSYFTYHDEYLYFLRDVSNGTHSEWIITSGENYSRIFMHHDLEADDDSAEIDKQNFRAVFENRSLDTVEFNTEMRITDVNYYLNDHAFQHNESYSFRSEIMASYQLTSDDYNLTQLVFAEKPRIFFMINSTEDINYTYTLELEMDDYSGYFADNLYNGDINYSNTCLNFSSSFLDLNFASEGVAINFPRSDVTLCAYNTSILYTNISTTSNGSIEYVLTMHNDVNSNFTGLREFARVSSLGYGMVHEAEGLSLSRIMSFNSSSYDVLKQEWGYPRERQFSILVRNSTGDIVIDYSDESPPEMADVVAKTEESFIVDKFGNYDPARVIFRAW